MGRTSRYRTARVSVMPKESSSQLNSTGRHVKNSDFIIEQYRRGKLARTFMPSGDSAFPWAMRVNGKVYLRTHGWVLSKILPTLADGSLVRTRTVAATSPTSGEERDRGA